jgi:hypothetical protein
MAGSNCLVDAKTHVISRIYDSFEPRAASGGARQRLQYGRESSRRACGIANGVREEVLPWVLARSGKEKENMRLIV